MDENPYQTPREDASVLSRRPIKRGRPMGTLGRSVLLYGMALNGAAIGGAMQGSGDPIGLGLGGLVGLAVGVVFLLVVNWRPKP